MFKSYNLQLTEEAIKRPALETSDGKFNFSILRRVDLSHC